ncbi:hypothetical protein SD70_20670 [Gordoniibacillus kamchatkensis]|uniref:Uncharacterized protein n=1 Tax=Gordoniibacillus kamchatkensis TaxID=1590651 RepID=A0ABR5AFJ7_9BACL|nr:hypothetical protein SD70_20670 [Paenibacillus sp. VKM B-2647]
MIFKNSWYLIEKIASVPAKPDNPRGMRIKGPRQQLDIKKADNTAPQLVSFSLKSFTWFSPWNRAAIVYCIVFSLFIRFFEDHQNGNHKYDPQNHANGSLMSSKIRTKHCSSKQGKNQNDMTRTGKQS